MTTWAERIKALNAERKPPADPDPFEGMSEAEIETFKPLPDKPQEQPSAPPAVDSPWGPEVPTFTYLAGAAGSGKTFLSKSWAEASNGKVLLCATTGIAAINLGGTTINSLLGYFDTKSLQESYTTGFLTSRLGKLYRSGVRRLIVDEVSMMDGDQLTILVRAVDELNGRGYVLDRKESEEDHSEEFGITLVGDFCQLPPVKAPFAFESPEWDRFRPNTHTLTEIRRQADPDFIAALRAARRGDGKAALAYFQARLHDQSDDAFPGPTIFAKNESVDRFNRLRMDALKGMPVTFTASRWGKQRSEWGNPDKPTHTWGIPERLALKTGALVMVLANRREEGLGNPAFRPFLYVNGDLGVLEAEEDQDAIVRLHRTGQIVRVTKVDRQVTIPIDSARRKELVENGEADKIGEGGKWEIVGGITYMPLRLAYATTVHKSQGLSLDEVQVNIRDAFYKTPGMLYVALSRARTAEGLRLVGSSAALVERACVDPKLKEYL